LSGLSALLATKVHTTAADYDILLNFSLPTLLVFHGSHDPGYQAAVADLMAQLRHKDNMAACQVAMLECSDRPLSQQIQDWLAPLADGSLADGSLPQAQILPLFLLPGVHVREDIPAQVAVAQTLLPNVALQVQPYLGNHPALLGILQQIQQLAQEPADTHWIVVAHGSRRAGGNQPVETIATALGATVAYGSVEPGLASHVAQLYDRGVRRICILPYILLTGAITDGINQQIATLQTQFSDLNLKTLPALDRSGVLVDLVTQVLLGSGYG
jgi:sirohydrochlorin cobaltochelatase